MRASLLVLCLLGALASGVLLRMGTPSEQGGGLSRTICTPSAKINCDYVLASRWARVGPLPSAVVGLVYFLSLGSWFALVGVPNAAGRRWHRVPLLVAGSGLIASAYFTLVMAAYLPVWCTWCLGVHGINAILFVACVLARPRCDTLEGMTPRPSRVRAWGTIGGTAGGAMLLASSVFAYQMQMTARRYQLEYLKATNNADYVAWRYSQATQRDMMLRGDDFVIGRSDAKHTVVAYTDFECSACAGFHRYAAHLTNSFPESVRIVFRHYPLSHECNSHAKENMHVLACVAARAAEAARCVGTWESTYRFHRLLFENAGRLAERPYEAFARDAKLDVTKWQAAFESTDVDKRIAADVETAKLLGVEGTPAIFLDGRGLESWHLLTTDASPVVDLEGTDRLWGMLLGRN